jgi:hypothetical protein
VREREKGEREKVRRRRRQRRNLTLLFLPFYLVAQLGRTKDAIASLDECLNLNRKQKKREKDALSRD